MSMSKEGAPDGAPNASDDANTSDTDTADKVEMISRDEAQKAFQARDEAKKRARELEKRLEDLESESAKASGDLTKQFEIKDAKIESLAKELADARAEIDKSKRQIVERDFAASVLEGVPKTHQSLAREVLEARILRGQYDLSDDADPKRLAKKAQKELAESHPQLFEQGPVPSTTTPGVSLGADEVSSLNEIPRAEWAEFARKHPERARELIRKMG